MADIELKPCPFCGCKKIIYTDQSNGKKNVHCIYCSNCGCGTAEYSGCSPHYILMKFVTEAWNRRAEDAAD